MAEFTVIQKNERNEVVAENTYRTGSMGCGGGGMHWEPNGFSISLGKGVTGKGPYEPRIEIEFDREILEFILPEIVAQAAKQGIMLDLKAVIRRSL